MSCTSEEHGGEREQEEDHVPDPTAPPPRRGRHPGSVRAQDDAWMSELRPQRHGGSTDYVMVQGVSMLPTYRSGDLVVVKPALESGVGDIVAYHVPAGDVGAGLTVIHRIVGGSATDGFVTKGDNNADVDDWHPTASDVEGIPWAVLPGGGRILAFLHAPIPLGALAAAIAVAMFSYESKDKTRRQASRRRRH